MTMCMHGQEGCYAPPGDQLIMVVEDMPEFPGGEDALWKYLCENTAFLPDGPSGVVYVAFCVMASGELKDVVVLRGADPLLDQEALRLVREMPPWKPALQRGKAFSIRYNLPIRFPPEYTVTRKRKPCGR